MHETYLSKGVIWSMSAVGLSGAGLAIAGWEAVGLGVWLGALCVQCIVGVNILANRRRARHR